MALTPSFSLIRTVVQIPFYYVTYMVNPGNTVESMIHWYQLLLGAWLLAMVLSVIFTVPFALTFYFLADDPEMGGIEALKASTHKMCIIYRCSGSGYTCVRLSVC